MVYIVGVDHLIQYNGPVPEYLIKEFHSFLKNQIRALKISIIAEEFNNEFLKDVYGATEDTAKIAAERAGIEHLYCDPESNERELLGIPYHADLKDRIFKRNNVRDPFLLDAELKRKIKSELNAEVKKYWDVREKFWLDKISNKINSNILFICGHEHAERFCSLLTENGITAKVIEKFWKKEIFSDYLNIGLR
ncbi:MAG TPA: hypothetical protein PK906_13325 [Spirochaetota bacterium]|nr:hypothetical protein [Spirochaetota bacterium]